MSAPGRSGSTSGRHDFSKWIDQVFGDYTLAAEIENLEKRNGSERTAAIRDTIIRLIEERYAVGQAGQES
jgi:hypothetical protein